VGHSGNTADCALFKPENMEVNFITRLNTVDPHQWNTLTGVDNPFLRHEFLLALEQSGSVSPQTGWQPKHIVVTHKQELLAVMPTYEKTHSWGEYVFDQPWAQAYQQHGLNYYPKLLSAIPFTPCQGPRLLIKDDVDSVLISNMILNFVKTQAEQHSLSSWHCLFPDSTSLELLSRHSLIIRNDVQFHWFNRDYQSFAEYLQSLTSSKRKMIKRERRKISEQGIHLLRLKGKEISKQYWQAFYRFYAMTYLKRSSQPYLNPAFFTQIGETMAEQLQLNLAVKNDIPVAAALSFIGSDTLYGRYWGCAEEYDALHFETCYYQGIEYCIEHNLKRFDSGAQGEHKIARGFKPVTTSSTHWIRDERFARAIAQFVERESKHVSSYKKATSEFLPFKQ
jgi:uncharacterized protein